MGTPKTEGHQAAKPRWSVEPHLHRLRQKTEIQEQKQTLPAERPQKPTPNHGLEKAPKTIPEKGSQNPIPNHSLEKAPETMPTKRLPKTDT